MSMRNHSFWLSPRMVIAFWVVALIVVGVLLCPPLYTEMKWVGRTEVPVVVQVFDADRGGPIAGAKVELFDGPSVPIEGPRSPPIHPSEQNGGVAAEGVTNHVGTVSFSHKFHSTGSRSIYSDDTWIDFDRTWVRISFGDDLLVTVPVGTERRRTTKREQDRPVWVTVAVPRRSPPN